MTLHRGAFRGSELLPPSETEPYAVHFREEKALGDNTFLKVLL
jgi:hypothetical protein